MGHACGRSYSKCSPEPLALTPVGVTVHSLKVLILEDHPFQLMALHQMLNANQVFDVLAAESVEVARLSLQSRGPVDIAICDLQMDGPDGLELIRFYGRKRVGEGSDHCQQFSCLRAGRCCAAGAQPRLGSVGVCAKTCFGRCTP
ncbi:Response regulator/EAL domain protein [Pseudomonas meliae]|uniref:Response regulator/EAL domain protein n=1 Tax=Pseudomonas meliae TaxID=86176 RepID=A0A0P9U2D5_9PSED|nr:Response regulator/EAL domain protein [Pseudomonas meliae]